MRFPTSKAYPIPNTWPATNILYHSHICGSIVYHHNTFAYTYLRITLSIKQAYPKSTHKMKLTSCTLRIHLRAVCRDHYHTLERSQMCGHGLNYSWVWVHVTENEFLSKYKHTQNHHHVTYPFMHLRAVCTNSIHLKAFECAWCWFRVYAPWNEFLGESHTVPIDRENRPLIVDKLVEFEKSPVDVKKNVRKITHRF